MINYKYKIKIKISIIKLFPDHSKWDQQEEPGPDVDRYGDWQARQHPWSRDRPSSSNQAGTFGKLDPGRRYHDPGWRGRADWPRSSSHCSVCR